VLSVQFTHIPPLLLPVCSYVAASNTHCVECPLQLQAAGRILDTKAHKSSSESARFLCHIAFTGKKSECRKVSIYGKTFNISQRSMNLSNHNLLQLG